MTGHREVADDALAEAFAQALARGDAIRQPRAWVWKVAVRVAAAQMKDIRRGGQQVPERAIDLPTPTVELLDLLRGLSPMQRAAVVLHYYAGYPLREAAGMTGSTAPAMAIHLRRARTKLRSTMEANDD
jgi:RNA polymerase sigma-70 factor (ECF subfamily)